jgi:hypothetical protein
MAKTGESYTSPQTQLLGNPEAPAPQPPGPPPMDASMLSTAPEAMLKATRRSHGDWFTTAPSRTRGPRVAVPRPSPNAQFDLRPSDTVTYPDRGDRITTAVSREREAARASRSTPLS